MPSEGMKPRFPRLYEALLTVVQKAIPIVASVPPSFVEDDRWARHEGMFYRQITSLPHPGIQLTMASSRITALPEYEEVRRVILEEPVLASQMDTLVGTQIGSSRMSVERVVTSITAMVLRTGMGFNGQAFDEAYAEVEDALASTSLTYLTVAPLVGIACDEDSIVLSSSLSIRKLTDEEMARTIELGLVHSVFGPGRPVEPLEFALVFAQSLPKRVGDQTDSGDQVLKWQEEPPSAFAHALSVLRMFKDGRIDIAGSMASTRGWLQSGTSYRSGDARPPYGKSYFLSPEEADELTRFYQACDSRAVRQSKGLEMAIRRFGYSTERRRPDDQIVDLMIAAEALLLEGRDNPDRGEQRYRLSLRGALLTPEDAWTRRQLFSLYRSAYDARSIVAHGGNADHSRLPDGREVPLAQFAGDVGKQLRKAIKRAVELCAISNRPFRIDWEASLLTGAPVAITTDRQGE